MKLELQISRDWIGPVLWQTRTASETPSSPPYSATMLVTPLSTFGDHCWTYPRDWASINNRNRLSLNFLSPARPKGFPSTRLCPSEDGLLLLQFKEAMVAITSRRDVIASARARMRYLSATGAHNAHSKLRRFFVAIKLLGKRSLRQVTPNDLVDLNSMLATSTDGFISLSGCLRDLLLLSKHGLISDGLLPLRFELTAPATIIDTSNSVGWQPFQDEVVADLIRLSNAYIDMAPAIAEQIKRLNADEHSDEVRHAVTAWAAEALPCGSRISDEPKSFVYIADRLLGFVQCAAGNLVSFHTGMRVAEQLSLRSGFAVKTESSGSAHEAMLDFTTFKMVNSIHGAERCMPCHPRLLAAQEALALVKEACGIEGDYMFVPRDDNLPYVTNAWNRVLKTFFRLHGLSIDVSSHRWRKTVAALAARVLTGAALHLKELFGHESLAMTARYIMASPLIRDELRDLTLDEYRKRGRTLLESLAASGGQGVGGRFGTELEERVSKLVNDSDITQNDIGQTFDDFVEEMLSRGIFLLPVMPGVMCAKPYTGRGECATSSGDRLADPGRCSATCAYQVQQAHRKPLLLWTIKRIARNWKQWSPLEQRYWAGQCRDQLTAWPDLVRELQQDITNWPALQQALREGEDGTA